MGGLVAALRLADFGLQVLVSEATDHPGGTAYVYYRKGFSFPMGPLGISSPEIIKNTFSELGLDRPQMKQVHYRLRAFDLDLPVSLPFAETVREFKKVFPADQKAIESFFYEVQKLDLSEKGAKDPDNLKAMERAAATSADDFLKTIVSDFRLRRIFGSMGACEPYSGMLLLSAMWQLLCSQGIWYLEGGTHGLAKKLIERISSYPNCEVRLGSAVSEIELDNGKAAGVRLSSGEKIKAEKIVSNADFKRTFLELTDASSLPAGLAEEVENARQTGSVFQVCLGTDRNMTDLSAFSAASRIIYQRHPANNPPPEWELDEIDPSKLSGQEMEISCWSKDDPSLAPPGKEVIVIRTEADYNHFSRFRTGHMKRTDDYFDYKMKLARALRVEASRIIPGLPEAVDVVDVATPLTFRDRGGRSEGAVAGWSWDYEDNRDYRARELVETPVAGLYMAGCQAFSSLFSGGVPTALKSGLLAADRLIKGNGPTLFRLPGRRDEQG